MPTLYQDVIKEKIEYDNHNSDLYIPASDKTRQLLEKHKINIDGHNVSVFKSNIDSRMWFDIAFAYDPYWKMLEEKVRLENGAIT